MLMVFYEKGKSFPESFLEKWKGLPAHRHGCSISLRWKQIQRILWKAVMLWISFPGFGSRADREKIISPSGMRNR